LYSPEQKLWKVADFGMTSNGSSVREVTTENLRGTSGYRAPELRTTSHFTNKVDIFGIGCIFFELFSKGQKAFDDDIEVVTNTIESRFEANPQLQHMFTPGGRTLLDRTLSHNPGERPTAKQLCSDFASQRWTAFAFECDCLGNNELVIQAFQMAVQLSKVESIIWKNLGDAYRVKGAYDDASAAYSAAILAGYNDRALMPTIEETFALASVERTLDSTENLVRDPEEGRSQLRTLASFAMEGEYREMAVLRVRRALWPWMMGVGFATIIWFIAFFHRF
jgi:serine/threonine protein kinase